jgi:hypothetical protein
MNTEIQVTAPDLLAIISRIARGVAAYCDNPPATFDSHAVLREATRLYSFADKLHEMVQSSAPKGEENGAEQAKAN